MKSPNTRHGMRLTLIALAVLSAIGQARAQQTDEVKELVNPDSSVSAGAAGLSGDTKDRAQFGMFNGMRKESGYLLLDVDFLRRDNATGTWTWLNGRNLGLDNREFRVGMQKQGDWKVAGEYNEITRYSPFTVNTGMTGVGTTRPNIVAISSAGSGSDHDFKLQRKAASASAEKWLTPNLKLEASVKSEDKNGTRLWGRGYDCAAYVCGSSTTTAINQNNFLKNAILLIPEPIDSTIRQFEARLVFHTDRLNLSAGYYGSFYTNANGNISPVVPNALYGGNQTLVPALYPAVDNNIIAGGGISLQGVLQSPMALQPDNQAHTFSVAGNYAFSNATRATFKYSLVRMRQNEDFLGMGLPGAPAGMSNLGGKVDGVNAQLGLTSRLTRDLNVLANVSYLHNDDKTPKALYNVEAKAVFPATNPASYTNINQPGIPGAVWFNNHTSKKDKNAKLEGNYRLPDGYRLTAGVDYRERERDVPESRVEEALAGLGPLREKNTETTYRMDLRRSMSDTVNGSIGYSVSERSGSDWTNLSTLDPTQPTPNTAINTYLINTYCGGQPCYGQVLPASVLIQLAANTPFPMSMADVERTKFKFMLDWAPAETVSVQFVMENGKDRNTQPFDPVAGMKGWRDSNVDFVSLDASWLINEKWKLTGYASGGDQTLHIDHSTGYRTNLRNRTTSAGLTLDGEATAALRVGASAQYLLETNVYGVEAATGTAGDRLTGLTVTQPSATNLAQAAVGLPEVVYRKAVINLFGVYALNKASNLRVDLAQHRYKYDDWVWGTTANPFVYADNTIVKQQINQKVNLVALTYTYRFR